MPVDKFWPAYQLKFRKFTQTIVLILKMALSTGSVDNSVD